MRKYKLKAKKPSKETLKRNVKKAYFVQNFLKQPCKTRSGRIYSRKQRYKSNENILGSLVTKKDKRFMRKGSKSTNKKSKCNCGECKSKTRLCRRKSYRGMYRYKNSRNGMDVLLKNQARNGTKLRSQQFHPDLKSKKRSKRSSVYKRKRGSLNRGNRKTRRHPLEESISISKRGIKISGGNRKRKGRNKRKRRKGSKPNLLKYVLKNQVSRGSIAPEASQKSADNENTNFNCPICNNLHKAVLEVTSAYNFKNTRNWMSKENEKLSRNYSQQLFNIASLIANGKNNETTPTGSAGPSVEHNDQNCNASICWRRSSPWSNRVNSFSSPKRLSAKFCKSSPNQKPKSSHFINSVLFPSAGSSKRKRCSHNNGNRDKLSIAGSEYSAKSKTNLLGNDASRAYAANSSRKSNGRSVEGAMIKQIASFLNGPTPSGHAPTYIAMVKTAIRDLKPFNLTSMEAISKYIHIRYRVKNDDLLRYILNWMLELGVLRQYRGYYVFSKKRLVKKQTVAVIRRKKNEKRRRKKKARKTAFRRASYRKKKGKRAQRKRGKKYSRRKKSAKRKKGRKRNRGCKKETCTCSKELNYAKNRVKLKTRYKKHNGKIYKYDEYV